MISCLIYSEKECDELIAQCARDVQCAVPFNRDSNLEYVAKTEIVILGGIVYAYAMSYYIRNVDVWCRYET